MSARLLITSDLHLTSREKDAYRLGILPWLKKKAKRHNADAVLILGDLTEFKDEHDSYLVNYVVDELTSIAEVCDLYLLRGNHDCKIPDNPFFRFLNHIEGIYFVIEPEYLVLGEEEPDEALFLPNSDNPEADWKGVFDEGVESCSYIFMHQPFAGARAESGKKLEGMSLKFFKKLGIPVYSGDIHVPQRLGPVRYIGAPYNVRFGDEYEPRVILLEDNHLKNLAYPAPRKWKLTMGSDLVPDKEGAKKGDMVKITMLLHRYELEDWAEHRRNVVKLCEENEYELHGIDLEVIENGADAKEDAETEQDSEPETDITDFEQVFEDYCDRQQIDQSIGDVGRDLLRRAIAGGT